MRIYHWESEFMADWGNKGSVVVMARNPDHARAVARTAFVAAYPQATDRDRQLFESDITEAPKVDSVGLFIRGTA